MSGRARWDPPGALFQRTAAFQRAPSTLFLNTSRHIPGTGSCAPARRDVDRVLPPLARSCRRVLPRKRICSPDVAIQLSAADRPYGNGQRPCRSAALTAARRGLSGRQGLSGVRGVPSDAEGARPFGDASLERKKANASFGCIRSCPSGEAAGALFPRRVLAFLSEQPRTVGGELSVGLLTDVFRRGHPRPAHTRSLPG